MGIFQRIIHDWPGRVPDAVYGAGRLGCRADLAERAVPANARAVLPGFVYQLGNLLASVNATLQARIAETHGGNYGLAMAIVAGSVAILICVFVALVARPGESSSPVQIATPSRSRPSVIARKHYAPGAYCRREHAFPPWFSRPFNEQQRLMMASAFRDHYNHRLLFSL